MSFRLFIYYCALCGGWAAFVVWALVQAAGVPRLSSPFVRAALIGGMLGGLVAASVGLVDALLNAAKGERMPRVLLCGTLGFAGGAAGGLVGEILNAFLGVPLFVGWMLAGTLIGGSVGAFDVLQALSSGKGAHGSFRKMRNGVYGGLLGGLLGGVPYTFLDAVPRLNHSGLTIGLVLLGSCIGLMIGLAQVVLLEAWLVVVEGFRPGRELSLTKEETTIGRGEGCDLGLFGDASVAKLHARVLVRNNRYLLAHDAEEGETLLNGAAVGPEPVRLRGGDAIHIGRNLLRFGERQKRR
jgi:hypothetical protein